MKVIFRVALLLLLLSFTLNAYSQRQRNYIYVFDCTRSMQRNFHIWEPAKKWLKEDISRQSDDATITIIPFIATPSNAIKFNKSDFNWGKIEYSLDSLINVPNTRTGICLAWDEGLKELNNNKDNYFYLLTDGEDNVNGYGKSALQERLLSWCRPNDYGFYVVLSKDAEAVLKDLNIDETCNLFSVPGAEHLPTFGAFTPNHFTVNLRNLKDKTLGFSTNGDFAVKTDCDDSYFSVDVCDGYIKNGRATFQVKPLQNIKTLIENLPERYDLECKVLPENEDKLRIVNDIITIHVNNRPIRNLDIISEEQEGESSWYDSFLFWGKKDQDTINLALDNTWNDLAKKHSSAVNLHITCETLKSTDYKMLLNDKEIAKDGTIKLSANNDNDVLSIIFSDDAPEDTHYFKIKASSSDCDKLESINDIDVNSKLYENSLRITYDIEWNPLKTFLFWLLILLIGLLLLWFLVLKPTMICKFKNSSIMVMDPYFSRIRVNGARKLVFTSKANKDNIIKRIFLGKTVYAINPIWRNDLVIEPGLKKSMKVIANHNYTINPYASNLKPTCEYDIIDTETNDKVKVMIQ